MSNKERTKWISYPSFAFDTLDVEVEGNNLKIIHPRKLIGYKKELDGEHQREDIRAAEAYLAKKGLQKGSSVVSWPGRPNTQKII